MPQWTNDNLKINYYLNLKNNKLNNHVRQNPLGDQGKSPFFSTWPDT